VKFKHVAVDGTKVKANASKHPAMSYERMLAEDELYGKESGRQLPPAPHAGETPGVHREDAEGP